MHEIREMCIVCIMYLPWKAARIPLLSIGQRSEPGVAQLLCGHIESEDSTFYAMLTHNVTLQLGAVDGGRRKGKSVFV